MVGFDPTPEQEQMRALARDFARDVVMPVAAQCDRDERYPEEVVARAHELGLLNVSVPEAQGGLGLGVLDECLLGEEIAYGCMGIYTILMASELGIAPLLLAADEAQRDRFLAPLLEAPRLAAFALSEPDNGSDAGGLRTRARLEDDEVILSGRKMWISNGRLASFTVTFATTDPGAGHRATVAVIVPAEADGLSWRKIHGKLGQRASPTFEMVLDEVRVPRANLLGARGDGFKIAMRTLDRTRIPVAAGAVGVARRALDESVRYAGQRQAFGRPIAELQAIQFKLADMAISVDTARAQTWRAATLADAGRPHGRAAAIAKTFASERAFDAANEAIHVFGGYGYVDEFPVAKLLRDVKLNQIYEGTNEIQRLVIARDLLRAAPASEEA